MDPPYGVDIAEWDGDLPPQTWLDECLRISRGTVLWFGAAPKVLEFINYKPPPRQNHGMGACVLPRADVSTRHLLSLASYCSLATRSKQGRGPVRRAQTQHARAQRMEPQLHEAAQTHA